MSCPVLSDRATLLCNNALFIIGGGLCAIAGGSSGLFVGRVLAGMAVGYVSPPPPPHLFVVFLYVPFREVSLVAAVVLWY